MSVIINPDKLIAGINWGAVPEKGWFGAIDYRPADLDLACYQLNEDGELVGTLSLGKRKMPWGLLSQDDMSGDLFGNDNEENEWIQFNLKSLAEGNKLLLSVINYTEQPLTDLLHFEYRLYTGEVNKVKQLHYFKNIKEIPLENNVQGIFLGVIERVDVEFLFNNKEIVLYTKDLDAQLAEIKDFLSVGRTELAGRKM